MDTVRLSVRDRMALLGRAIAGSLTLEPGSVGAKLLSGVVQSGTPPARGVKDYLASYSQMPWLRAVASRISYDIAAVAWELYVERQAGKPVRNRMVQRAPYPQRGVLLAAARKAGPRKAEGGTYDDGLEQLGTHPLLDLLDRANPVQTGLQMRKVTQIHLDLVGEAFWLLERGALEQPVALWPVPPHWVAKTPSPAQPWFRMSFRGWQGTVPASEVIWFTDVDPLNPYGRGTGTAQALADELETDEYAAQHTKAFFYNRGRPDLIVYPKGGGSLTEDNVRRLEEDWSSRNTGFWRAFRPYFLQREVEVKSLDQNFRAQQLVPLREFERDTILQVFGVSPETLGILGAGSNRATVTMGDTIYGRRVQVPRLETLRAVMQECLAPLFDERLIVDYCSPVTKDHELELEAGKVAPWSLTVDEWRARQGQEPLEGDVGRVFMVPSGLTAVREADLALPRGAGLGAPRPMPVAPGGPGGDVAPTPAVEPEPSDVAGDEPEEAEERAAAVRDALVCAAVGDAESAKALEAAAESAPDDPEPTRIAAALEGRYRRAQEAAWRALGAQADEARLAGALAAGDPDAAVVALGGDAALARAMTSPLETFGRLAFVRGFVYALRTLPAVPRREPVSIGLQDANPEAVRWARAAAARLVRAVGTDVRAAIRALIAEALDAGIAPREVARRLRTMVGLLPAQVQAVASLRARLAAEGITAERVSARVARYTEAQHRLRAVRIARTELIGATNAGQQSLWDTAKQRGLLPKDAEKVWIVTLDDALDQTICAPLQDVAVPVDESFPGGYAHPPAHPMCRCAIGLKV